MKSIAAVELSIGSAAPRNLCTDCGVSRTSEPSRCAQACQFIAPDYPGLEERVHGRVRVTGDTQTDERFFGVFQSMYRARLKAPAAGAQWTGITTRIAERLLETNQVDAVLTMGKDDADPWRPVPILVTEAGDMAQARGMRMGFAPILALLEPALELGYRRLAVIGIPCQVYALRALEKELGFERLYVVGTPCSDNTSTENFHEFLALLSDAPETITYLEFRADYHVELRFSDGSRHEIPFLKLPIADLDPEFFPLTCRTCVDYTNSLADITVGYMGGEGDQWLLVRNDRGAELLALIEEELTLDKPGSKGKRQAAVKGFIENTRRAAGGLPLRRMPNWLRGVVGFLQPRIGPRGLEFARTRLEMKAAETVIHLRRKAPAKMKSMIPDHLWSLVSDYGITPEADEIRSEKPEKSDRATRSPVIIGNKRVK